MTPDSYNMEETPPSEVEEPILFGAVATGIEQNRMKTQPFAELGLAEEFRYKV
jgi:hypothetical protein